jgi:hypothetical protein
MKSRYIVLALLFSAGVILTLTSCRTRYIPTYVVIATDTPTITNTPLNTPTPTLTPSFTLTRTFTPTPTITNTHTPTITLTPVGPTSTFTDTPTLTNTPTITLTFTITETPTITNTPLPTSTPTDTSTSTATPTITDTPTGPTSTPTATLCPATFQTTYTFDASTECWSIFGSGAPVGSSVQLDSTHSHSGTGSVQFILPYTASGGQALLGLQYNSPVSMAAGTTLSMWVSCSQSTGNGQIYNFSGPTTAWQSGGWQNDLPVTWRQISWSMNLTDPSLVEQFGLQFPGGSGAITTPVTLWIDDVTLTAPAVVPTCVALLNGCENLTENGNWTTPDGRSTLALSTTNVTQGSNSMDINVTTANGWNKIAGLDHFWPMDWSSVTKMIVDMHVDASVTTSTGGWCQLALQADSSDGVLNSSSIYTTAGDIKNGSVTVFIGMPPGGAPVTNLLRKLYFVLNEGAGTAGHIYIDNIRLMYSPSCPTATPTPIAGANWTFEDGTTQSWVLGAGAGFGGTGFGAGTPGLNSTYCLDLTRTFTTGNERAGAELNLGTAINGTTFNGIRAKIYVDASISGDYPCVFIQLGDGANYPQSTCVNPAQGGWMQLDFPASSWGTFTKSTISYIKVYIQSASAAPYGTGHVKIDNIEFY